MDGQLACRTETVFEIYRPGYAVTPMTGEGIVVEKAEASSALIYWDGKQYRWLQLSD
jgi:hypothetical protein